jgi:hypothetical protein
MKCEICKAIEKLGLDPATHELWACADAMSARLALKKAHISIHHFCHELTAFVVAKWQHARYMPYQRTHYVTLGL